MQTIISYGGLDAQEAYCAGTHAGEVDSRCLVLLKLRGPCAVLQAAAEAWTMQEGCFIPANEAKLALAWVPPLLDRSCQHHVTVKVEVS